MAHTLIRGQQPERLNCMFTMYIEFSMMGDKFVDDK